jgi:hypothetical protein
VTSGRDVNQAPKPAWWKSPKVVLAGIITAASILATVWVFLVPIFEGPDEPQHFDYALSIAGAGHLLNARERPTLPNHWALVVSPDVQYLMQATGFWRVVGDQDQRMPAGYGTIAYYQQLDQLAPRKALDGPPPQNPGLLPVYPFGYYALLGAWLWLVGHLTLSVTVLFFSARLLSVLMLPATLLLCYAISRELGMTSRMSLFLTAVIGLFPLTSFVASAIQPDNLSFLLVSLAVYLALLVRRRGQVPWLLASLGLALGCLLVTKTHYFLSLAIPIAAVLLLQRHGQQQRTGPLRAGLLLTAPSLALLAVHLWVVWGTTIPVPSTATAMPNWADLHTAAALGPLPFARYVGTALGQASYTYYLGGDSFRTFWGTVGWLGRIQFGAPVVYQLIYAIEVASSLVVLVIMARHFARTGVRLVRLGARGRAWTAIRLALVDPFLIAYLLFTGFMFAYFVFTHGTFYPQGRNWLPFLLPTWMLAFHYAPRALRRQPSLAARLPVISAAGLALLCLVVGAFAIFTIEHRFYATAPGIFS